MSENNLPIRVINPRKLPGWELPAERIPLGIPGDYKPTVAMLPDGELVILAFIQEILGEGRIREWTVTWRSKDGGRTWSEREIIKDMIGREHVLTGTSDGILFSTCHHLINDITNTDGVVQSYLHRSEDGGRTWESTKILVTGDDLAEVERELANVDMTAHYVGLDKPEAMVLLSRNVLEMPDGFLLLGVSVSGTRYGSLWKSIDRGKTWQPTPRVTIAGYYDSHPARVDSFFSEDFNYRMVSGKLIHFIRVGPLSPMTAPCDGRAVLAGDNDNLDRMMICESSDDGRTWEKLRNIGDYGVMWPRMLRLRDGRLLLTYTQRSLFYPLGLRAIVSYDDGETWDFNSDQIIIEGKTPWGMVAGGGFGNTVQLEDDSLVSCYSYRGTDEQTHVEVVRWRLT